MNISQELKRIRKAKCIRQGVIAKKAGITQTYLSLIESGNKTPSIEVIENLCKVYDMPFGVVMWNAITEKDVKPNRRDLFRRLKPSVDSLIKDIFI